MRFHRFYVDANITGPELKISDTALLHQWRNVFRYNVGSFVILFDGSGFDYVCQIAELSYRSGLLLVTEKKENKVKAPFEVTIFQSLLKKDNFELVVQKATELGVSKIVPILSERSEKKKIEVERLRRIAIEAVEQSGRSVVPEISPLVSLEEALSTISSMAFVLDSSGSIFKAESLQLKAYSFLIGPEGGWSEKEKSLFASKQMSLYSLGDMTLRAETVSIAVLASVLL